MGSSSGIRHQTTQTGLGSCLLQAQWPLLAIPIRRTTRRNFSRLGGQVQCCPKVKHSKAPANPPFPTCSMPSRIAFRSLHRLASRLEWQMAWRLGAYVLKVFFSLFFSAHPSCLASHPAPTLLVPALWWWICGLLAVADRGGCEGPCSPRCCRIGRMDRRRSCVLVSV